MTRKAEEIAYDAVDDCIQGKFDGELGLLDFDPLIIVMNRVAEVIHSRTGSFDQPEHKEAWLLALEEIQVGEGLEHNNYIPCRRCDQAFEPVVDETLLDLFLKWEKSGAPADLLAIHRCPDCGGQLKAKRTKQYKGDWHTPEPGSIDDDRKWAEYLLRNYEF